MSLEISCYFRPSFLSSVSGSGGPPRKPFSGNEPKWCDVFGCLRFPKGWDLVSKRARASSTRPCGGSTFSPAFCLSDPLPPRNRHRRPPCSSCCLLPALRAIKLCANLISSDNLCYYSLFPAQTVIFGKQTTVSYFPSL